MTHEKNDNNLNSNKISNKSLILFETSIFIHSLNDFYCHLTMNSSLVFAFYLFQKLFSKSAYQNTDRNITLWYLLTDNKTQFHSLFNSFNLRNGTVLSISGEEQYYHK